MESIGERQGRSSITKTDYSPNFSVKVKTRANYTCEKCGSTEFIQAHAPNGDHSDWRKGIALCAGCHADEHPNVPRNLFFVRTHQPYWPNISANSIAKQLGCQSRTVIRTAKRLEIPIHTPLSLDNKTILITAIHKHTHRKPGVLLPIERSVLEAATELQKQGIQEFHGFQIAKELKWRKTPRSLSPYGRLYRTLGQLEQRGYLSSRWEEYVPEQHRPRRRYYSLTDHLAP